MGVTGMALAGRLIRLLGGTPMAEKDVERLQRELKELLAENDHLVKELVELSDKLDVLESASSVSEKELQHLRGIAAISLSLRDFLVNRDYQAAVVRFSRTLANAQEENLL
jgi:regulator of replication initiation timing